MLTWLNKKPNCQKYAKQIDFAIVDTFKFTESNSSISYSSSSSRETNFIFHCCVIEIVMTKKQNGSILLSNAQRHISNNCWLNETKVQGMLTKNKDSSRKVVEYFRLPTRHVVRKESTQSSIVSSQLIAEIEIDINDDVVLSAGPKPSIAENSENTNLIDSVIDFNKMAEIASDHFVKATNGNPTSENLKSSISKNLHVLVGILDHTELNGH